MNRSEWVERLERERGRGEHSRQRWNHRNKGSEAHLGGRRG